MRNLVGFLLCVGTSLAFGQQENLAALRYPDLARRTRIQGDVRIIIDTGDAHALSGNPLLATPHTFESAKLLGTMAKSVELIFHFQLVGRSIRPIQRKEARGDAFDRRILWLFHQPTFRIVDDTTCSEARDIPPNHADLTRSPVEVWIYEREACTVMNVDPFGAVVVDR
jgi:hypothetical protein